MKAVIVLTLACVTGCAGLAAAQDAPKRPGLTLGQNGTVLKDGQPYRGIGVNYFSAFSRTLTDPADTSYREGFDELARRGIPFARFMAGGFWAKDWSLYREDREAWFRLMDGVVRAAEERGIGLIPSVFWWYPCVPDIVGEPCSALGDPNSKTIAFMREYAAALVTRYMDSPAIWAWEMGNEYSLAADLPNAADHRPWVHPELGTPTSRSEADDLTSEMVTVASREFAKAVRQHDPYRLITPGHSLPRASAHHLKSEGQWTQDTPGQFEANLVEVNPMPSDLISVHVYPFDREKRFGKEEVPFEETLRLCMKVAADSGKALFVGEFGAGGEQIANDPVRCKTVHEEMLAAIESTGVPLSAVWVFDLPQQDNTFNITPKNERAYLLDMVAAAHGRVSGSVASP